MSTHKIDDLTIITKREGAREFSKVSYPLRYGRFAEIKGPEYTFQFNLNGEINEKSEEKGGIKRKFYRIKTGSRLPTFLYLIQRL